MLKKWLFIGAGSLLIVFALVTFFILPGSILLIVLGLLLISMEWHPARRWLRQSQNCMRRSAERVDRFLLARKYRR